ncbi:ATP-binding protein [Mycobacterium senriense]|uniref:ATP-binding protein n=1 Tax=Mycobacterium senriense TaxID=2775496 RepID=UPI002022D9DB|nr:ATP-binding protein [Mycobacterium senriense]
MAIAGTSVIAFSVALSARVSLPMTVGVAAAFACGSASEVGWAHLGEVFNLYYFALQWTTSALIRVVLLRVAAAVDRARADRQATEVNEEVMNAVREFEREQLALLHDTAASTLLMVGQGTMLPPPRLAAQARRDLELLEESPWVAPPARTELVAALRQCAAHLSTPVRFVGSEQVWLDGEIVRAVIAAAREAMNNVDRHANAGLLTITVSSAAVVLEDDGVGFEFPAPQPGHGIADSIVGRMRRAGGDALIGSAPAAGTRVEMSWPTGPYRAAPVSPVDPERMIHRSRAGYGLALTTYAVANVVVMFPYSLVRGDHPAAQVLLAGIAVTSTLMAVSGIRHGRWRARRMAVLALAVVTAVQPLLLPPAELGGQHHWAQAAVGWCLLPLLLGSRAGTGAALLVGYWVLGAGVELSRAPSAEHVVNIGLGAASILGVQLFALAFTALMSDAAADAQAETEAHHRLIRRDRVAQAVRVEYRQHYATLVDNVVPLLETLSRGGAVDDDVRRRARAESRRLRVLFDQAAVFDHALMRRLRPAVNEAAFRQIDVAVGVAGELPELTDAEIDALVAPLVQVLQEATSSARVVVCTTSGECCASIVCDQISDADSLNARLRCDADDVDVDVVAAGQTVWVLVRHRFNGRAVGGAAPRQLG